MRQNTGFLNPVIENTQWCKPGTSDHYQNNDTAMNLPWKLGSRWLKWDRSVNITELGHSNSTVFRPTETPNEDRLQRNWYITYSLVHRLQGCIRGGKVQPAGTSFWRFLMRVVTTGASEKIKQRWRLQYTASTNKMSQLSDRKSLEMRNEFPQYIFFSVHIRF